MKKLIFLTLTIITFSFIQAQDEDGKGFTKNDIFISGAFGYNTQESGSTEEDVFTFTPRAGFFINEKIVVGLRAGYTIQSAKNVGINNEFLFRELDESTLQLGGFVRYYTTPLTKFSFFGEFSASYLNLNTDFIVRDVFNEDINSGDFTENGFNVVLSPGINYFLSNNFAIEAVWGAIFYQTIDRDGGESTSTFEIGLDLDDITLGLIYKF